MANWPPSKDADLANYLTAATATISGAAAAYGVSAPTAAALVAAAGAFVDALALCTDPVTRTEATVGDKDVKRAVALALFRPVCRQIQANPAVTAEMKLELGLPIHKATRTPRPAPGTKPILSLIGPPTGFAVPVQIVDETTPTKRAKPVDVDAAEVFSYVLSSPGEEPPLDLELWRYEGLATKNVFSVDYNQADEGKTTVIKAVWINSRGERGPQSAPITTKVAA